MDPDSLVHPSKNVSRGKIQVVPTATLPEFPWHRLYPTDLAPPSQPIRKSESLSSSSLHTRAPGRPGSPEAPLPPAAP